MKNSTNIQTLKSLNKPQRYSIPNVRGLHLWVRSPDLNKYWIWRFSYLGRRYDYSLGSFPEVSLAQATSKVAKGRAMLMDGLNPLAEKAREREERKAREAKKITFKDFAHQYIEVMAARWSGRRQEQRWTNSLATYAFPVIGSLSLEEIETRHVLEILRPIWATRNETASKLRGRIQKVLSAAITQGLRTSSNPAEFKNHLENVLPSIKREVKHHKALPYQDVPDFFKHLMKSNSMTSLALQFTWLNAARTGETIYAKRTEVAGNVWTVPSHRMKMRVEHVVPLCPRSIEILNQAASLDPESDFLFSINGRPLSNMSMLMACRRYQDGLTTHGGRASFRTWASDTTEHDSTVLEMCLAHRLGDAVSRAYNRAKMLSRREKIMLEWESFCLGKTSLND